MTTEERLALLEQIIGTQFVAARDTRSLAAELKPANQLPTGQYPYILSDYQIRVGIADLEARTSSAGATGPQGPKGDTGPPGAQGVAGTGGGGTGDVASQLAAFDIHIAPGKLAIGMQPDMRYDAQIQIGAAGSAEILGRSNLKGLDGQNPTEVHTNILSVAGNDGGIRLLQYLGWGPNGKIRNTTNRRASVLAIDSMGDVCKSTQEIGEDQDGGQTWYIRSTGKVVDFATYKVGGFIRILKSVAGYGSTDSQQL